jgi:membrane associated rhomboid family serine protease
VQNFYTPKLTPVNKVLLIIMATIFLAHTLTQAFMELSLLSYLGLSMSGVLSGRLHTLVTFPWFHMDLLSGLFSALILWYTGSELEMSWGSKRYLQFIMWLTLSSGIFFLALVAFFFSDTLIAQIPLAGSTGIGLGLLVVYAMLYPERHFSFFMLFPMKARHFCMLLGAIQLYTAIFSPMGKTTWGHLAAMGFAYLYMVQLQTGGQVWKFWQRFPAQQDQKLKDLKKIRHPHLFLVKDDDDSTPPKGQKPPSHWH